MSCVDCGNEVGKPYVDDIELYKDEDLYIRIQGVDDGNEFNFDAGDITLKIYSSLKSMKAEEAPLYTYLDAEWTKSQSTGTDEVYNDVVELTVPESGDVGNLTLGKAYPFIINFHITAENRTKILWADSSIIRTI